MHNIDSVEFASDTSEAAAFKIIVFCLKGLIGGNNWNSSVEVIALSPTTWNTDAVTRRPVPHGHACTVPRHSFEVSHSVQAIVLHPGKAVLVLNFKRISIGLSLVNQAESGATVLKKLLGLCGRPIGERVRSTDLQLLTDVVCNLGLVLIHGVVQFLKHGIVRT